MTSGHRVALATCAELPDLDADTRLLIAPLEARGVSVTPAVWDDPRIDWTTFDLTVVRSCWDYVARRSEFVAWACRTPRLANSARVIEWNTDKQYLWDLAERGIPVVPTTWLQPHHEWRPDDGEWVIKPAVSASSLDTGRYDMRDPEQRALAVHHVRRLQTERRPVMVQPYLRGIETEGETSLIYFAGEFIHAIRKDAVLKGPDTGVDRRFLHEGGQQLEARQPTRAQLTIGDAALAAAPVEREKLLYARVDLIPGTDGSPLVIELELTEPQLYLARAEGSAERLASLIAERVRSAEPRVGVVSGSGHPTESR
jgi:hypothetical protein